MTHILVTIFKFIFAAILAVATLITVILLSPFWLAFWVWKQINQKNTDS